MMRLPEFTRLTPSSAAEACQMLYEHKGEAKAIAGGTDLLVSMKQRVVTPRYLVDLATIPDLAYLSFDEKAGLRIGPLTRIATLASHPELARRYPAIAQAAASVGACQLQHMGTVGGNICLDTRCWYYQQSPFWRKSRAACIKYNGDICHMARASKVCVAVYSGDMAPALIALGAVVSLVGHKGEQVMPLSDLYTGDGKAYMKKEPDEIVREISVPAPEPGGSSAYMKFRTRRAVDFPLVGVAANLVLKGGECTDARVVFNAVASAPVIAHDASGHLKGKSITSELIEEVSQKAYREARPISSTGGCSPAYRKKMAAIYTGRVLKAVISQIDRQAEEVVR
jgi:4-hydroxybenzoyl-CoA reductase subunit beta